MRHVAYVTVLSLLAVSGFVVPAAQAGPPPQRPEIVDQVCVACHAIGGAGGQVGPALDGVGNRYDKAWLDKWLKDPAAVKPGTAMPNLGLPDDVRKQLVEYLSGLK